MYINRGRLLICSRPDAGLPDWVNRRLLLRCLIRCRKYFRPGTPPKPLGDRQRIDIQVVPPGYFIAGLMQLAVMPTTKRNSKFDHSITFHLDHSMKAGHWVCGITAVASLVNYPRFHNPHMRSLNWEAHKANIMSQTGSAGLRVFNHPAHVLVTRQSAFGTTAMLMGANNERIDHLYEVIIMDFGESFNNEGPDPSPPPANETIVAAGIVAKALRQIARDAPDHMTKKMPLRTRRSSTRGTPLCSFTGTAQST